ncbi:citramalate synthase [Rhodocaloribacter litoris]|uniref:citramalate synthase n=1 Tax=Rhodocaloribacter litoris TaxID=2558931 RepID=UPI0014209F32|nr:citramalate synthase [Rhodocaloribacter litoris]QXD14182.1 citramalate synthase [Rhodocaloribacter litoris]
MPHAIELFDTTLRDGTQGEHVSLSARDKLRIARRLDAFGIDLIEGGWPGSNPKDQAFFEQARDVAWRHARLCAFGSTRRVQFAPEDDPNLAAMLAAGTPVVSIFGKSWTLHAEVALGVSRDENLDLIASSVAYLKAQGKHVVYDAEHFFDGYADDPAYALATLEAAAEAGADVLVLCDTNGGTLPQAVYEVVREVCTRFDRPVGIHAHNDGGCAVANTLMAVQAGARHVQGTIGGIGERCGNADLCAVIPGLQLKLGYDCVAPAQLRGLTELAHFVQEVANLDPVDRAPYVGRSAFAHKGGVHVSAVMKEPRAYEHLEPETIGNRRRVLVSDLSGRSNVRYKAAELGLKLTEAEAALAVRRIKELEHHGYEFEGAEASFELLLRAVQGEAVSFFELERLRVRSDIQDVDRVERSSRVSSSEALPAGSCTEATIVVRVGGRRELAVAEGTGPVDALSNALRQVLAGCFPSLERVRLSDYKVRVVNPEEGTGAAVRVLVEHRDDTRSWVTVGVSSNILDASWRALADGIRYYLWLVHPAEASPSRAAVEPAPA